MLTSLDEDGSGGADLVEVEPAVQEVAQGVQGEGHRGEGGAGGLQEEAAAGSTLGGVEEGHFAAQGDSGLQKRGEEGRGGEGRRGEERYTRDGTALWWCAGVTRSLLRLVRQCTERSSSFMSLSWVSMVPILYKRRVKLEREGPCSDWVGLWV